MEHIGYTIRRAGDFYICSLLDKRVQGLTQIFQSMGKTKNHAIKRMNKMLKPHGFIADMEFPQEFLYFLIKRY